MSAERLDSSRAHLKSRNRENNLAIKGAIEKYKKLPLTPELVNGTWTILWQKWGEKIEHVFEAPSCNFTSEELGELRGLDRGVLLVPDEVYAPEGLILLGKIFPEITSDAMRKLVIVNDSNKGGCIAIDMDIDPPDMSISEIGALGYAERIRKLGKHPQRFVTYLIGSRFNYLLTRQYFDKNTDSFLPGSRWAFDDRILLVHSTGEGNANIVADVGSNDDTKRENQGVRSEWYKKSGK